MATLSSILVSQWYQPKPWGWLLWPMSQVFKVVVRLRQFCYQYNIFTRYRAPMPVIVVGNITVGGTGKTPFVIYLAQQLQQQGINTAIAVRAYKGRLKQATIVNANSDPTLVGDEAVLLAKRCSCLVAAAKKRVDAVKALASFKDIDIILCDDGLQHYAIDRDLEIAIVDKQRGLGNGFSLPMGPLRETPQRLQSVDLVLKNGEDMQLQYDHIYSLLQPRHTVDLKFFVGRTVHAIAAIGNPQRYFRQLRDAGVNVIEHEFPDHHAYTAKDITFLDRLPVLMTEKDAVKCRYFANTQHWVVAASLQLTPQAQQKMESLIAGVLHDR